MSSEIMVHDEVSGDRRGCVTEEQATALVEAGKGFAVRDRHGKIRRIMLHREVRVTHNSYEGIAALSAGSRTTRPGRGEGGRLLGDPRTAREHGKEQIYRPPEPMPVIEGQRTESLRTFGG